MFRTLLVWFICVLATLISVLLAHVGIMVFEILIRLPGKASITLLVATLLPIFFLGFMSVCLAFLSIWTIKRLFRKPATLPDFM